MATGDSAVRGGKARRQPPLVVFAMILGLSALVVLAVIWFIDRDGARRSATAPAEVVESAPQSWREGRTNKSGYRVLYRFQAAGRTYEGLDERNGWYKPEAAGQLRVCYDPDNPADSDLRSSTGVACGKGLLF